MKTKVIDTNIYGGGKGIIYVDGKYYLLSESPAKVCVSEDLSNWTEYQLNENYLKPANIAYGNGIFIITGASSTSADTWYYRSTDGVNWTSHKFNTNTTFGIILDLTTALCNLYALLNIKGTNAIKITAIKILGTIFLTA